MFFAPRDGGFPSDLYYRNQCRLLLLLHLQRQVGEQASVDVSYLLMEASRLTRNVWTRNHCRKETGFVDGEALHGTIEKSFKGVAGAQLYPWRDSVREELLDAQVT